MITLEQKLNKKTYLEYGVQKLELLCNAIGFNDRVKEITDIFESLSSSWGDRLIGDNYSFLSDVTDDYTPFEISIAFHQGEPELRILTEAQGVSPSLQSSWEAGLNLNHWLKDNFKVNFERFHKIETLFFPDNPKAKFSIWHAVSFKGDREPKFKIYLNPQAQGESRANAIIEDCLVKLDFPEACRTIGDITKRHKTNKIAYFSLDISTEEKARTKIYIQHYDASLEDLEKALSIASNYSKGEITEFCRYLVDDQTLFTRKPLISCFSFITGDRKYPSSGTFYLPISNYAANDGFIRSRLHNYFIKHNLPTLVYESAIQSLAIQPLDDGLGMHAYTSFRMEGQKQLVTIYFGSLVSSITNSNRLSMLKK
jgi:DMATS type aromatic prenyltransferase